MSETTINTNSTAYLAGQKDGSAWEFDGDELATAKGQPEGWDEATINAIGSHKCAAAWGCKVAEGAEWEQACAEYNAGAYAAVCER